MKDNKDESGYRTILKGTAIFGGVQVFNIVINLIRGKLVALFLGPEGMGIFFLLTSSSNTIQQFSSLGLNLSIVREVSQASGNKESNYLSRLIVIVRRLLYCSATIGAIITVIFSSELSKWAFGNIEYRWHFICLSIVVFFTTLSNGELSILQGVKFLKRIAFASIVGAFVGLFIGVPLYYFYRYDGIVPSMIILSIVVFVFYRYHSSKISVSTVVVSWFGMLPLVRKMVSLGMVMMIATLLGTLSNYLLNAYISNYGSIEDVGLYQAANSITNQYVGLVFTAMSLDFFPRLSAICSDNNKVRMLVNQQSEVVLLIVAPLVLLLIVTSPLVIRLLLTKSFISLIPVIRWFSLGLFFKAIAFPMSYISFSKGDRKTFFWLEGVASIYVLGLNVMFYHFWGVEGIAISFCLLSFFSCFLYSIVTRKLYNFYHDSTFLRLVVIVSLFIFSTFLFSYVSNSMISYFGMVLLLIVCTLFCLRKLSIKTGFFRKKV